MSIRIAVITVAVLTFVGSQAFAQTVSGGIKGGVNFANIDVETGETDEPEFDTKPGLIIGGFVDVPFTDAVSFQPEFLFTQKGAKLEEFGDEFDVDVDFIQIPLLLKLKAPTGGTRPFVVVGPAFGFKTSATTSLNGVEEDIDDDTESVEFSGIIGGGLEVGPGILEVRYDYGFNDLDKDEFSEARSRTFSVLFGIAFGR